MFRARPDMYIEAWVSELEMLVLAEPSEIQKSS